MLHRTLPLHATIVTVALAAAGVSALAQGKLDARYSVTLAGVPIGKGAWVIDIADDQYTAAASGMTTGLLRVFASGQGSGASRGHVGTGGNLVPSSYASSITADKKTEELRIVLHNGTVKEFVVDPPTPPHPERIPLTDAHRKGVTDPMTAALVRVPGNGDPMSSEVCAGVPPCSTAACATTSRWRSSVSSRSRRSGAIRARWWCARSISRRLPATFPTVRRSNI